MKHDSHDLLKEYDRRLREALNMATKLSDELSNDTCSKLGYQDMDEDMRAFLKRLARS